MVFAYKAFNKDLTCTKGSGTFQYETGMWFEEKTANCAQNGFHAASNPLDCLTYYPDMENSRYFEVMCDGDIDEDGRDSRLSCTKIFLSRELDAQDFVAETLKYIRRHPNMPDSTNICREHGQVKTGQKCVIVRGKRPIARGPVGTWVGFVKEKEDSPEIDHISMVFVNGSRDGEHESWFDDYGHFVDPPEGAD